MIADAVSNGPMKRFAPLLKADTLVWNRLDEKLHPLFESRHVGLEGFTRPGSEVTWREWLNPLGTQSTRERSD